LEFRQNEISKTNFLADVCHFAAQRERFFSVIQFETERERRERVECWYNSHRPKRSAQRRPRRGVL
jgi:hypothetical protein